MSNDLKFPLAIFRDMKDSAARLKAVVQVEFAKVVVWRNYEGAVQGVMQQVRMQVG